MSSIKPRRMSVRMSEHEVDEVTFLTGESTNANKRTLYEQERIAVCSQKRAVGVALLVFFALFFVAVIIAFATPLSGCSFLTGPSDSSLNPDEGSDEHDFISESGELFPWTKPRLPTDIKPTHYTISIHPNLTTLDVTGWVVIRFEVLVETSLIVLHSRNITIIDKWVKEEVEDGHRVEPLNISQLLEYRPFQMISLEMKDESALIPGKNYSLGIRFHTNISTELEGFYLSSYVNSQGERRYLATTHFEPTYARSAFPCFDEPQFKAAFKMIIIRNQFHKSLFNMPIKKIETVYYGYNMELWRDEFEESVEMSTYLVAFVICDYESISNKTSKKVEVSIHTPHGLLNQAQFALQTAVQLMDYYDEFFSVAYPLPKQDLIAIPDFGAGAMENWGLITYRETSILYDKNESSSAAHQWVAVVVAHELAHQWFGNLVTMRWWNDLWLNEGFASFVEYVGVDHIQPDWKMMEQFVLEKTQTALALDALASSHPISVDVRDPREIEAIFDTISYNKGAAILYMLESVLGQSNMRHGLMDYLNEHKFDNADTDDLWTALSSSANDSMKVKTIMDTWTLQMGYPLIRVRIENNSIRASQTRFLLNAYDNETELEHVENQFGYKWYIPLTYVTDLKPRSMQLVWMNRTDYEFSMSFRAEWIKFNVNQTGFYRVQYEGQLWDSLIKVLLTNPFILSPTDRASLIDDAFTLCKAGLVDANIPLELSQYLSKETEYVPWATALEHFRSWSKVLYERKAHRPLIQYVQKLTEPIYKKVGWADSGTHLFKLLRGEVLSTTIHCENKDAEKEAMARFDNWMKKGVRVPPNLREVVYSAGVKYGGVTGWDYCWSKYNSSRVPSEKKILLKAMGSAADPWLLQQYLEACLDREVVRPQDVRTVLGVVAANPSGRLLAWRHLRAHWLTFQSMFGEGSFTMGSLITAVVGHFSNEFDYREVTDFFSDKDVGSGTRALNQSLETIRLNMHWLQNNEDDIEKWLQSHLR
ncbi:endoplasmic reticulum aminopeptidase 2 [Folsomia candida]|uniref:endoplasmic reticulum aminopeptidase 2 n=1 Tax=Folsomia candida TaxID=158441 RepID=UPI000B8F177A|nr:endoplasmic reticulum aminopeptidase 2 [Folsomia candida]